MDLPTEHVDVAREFAGQRFVRHEKSTATWKPGPDDGFESRDTGIADATRSLAIVEVLRPTSSAQSLNMKCDSGIVFSFLLHGSMQGRGAGESFILVAVEAISISEFSRDLEILRIAMNLA